MFLKSDIAFLVLYSNIAFKFKYTFGLYIYFVNFDYVFETSFGRFERRGDDCFVYVL